MTQFTPVLAIKRRCVRCGIIDKLDRAGYCDLCQYELATGKAYINWRKFAANWHKRGWTWGREAA